MLQACNLFILLLNDNRHLFGLSLQVNQSLFGLIQFLLNGCLHIRVVFKGLSQLHFCIDLLLLDLVVQLLFSLLRLVQSDFLLEGVVFVLLVFQHQLLNLTVELLTYHFILLHNLLHLLLLLLLLLLLICQSDVDYTLFSKLLLESSHLLKLFELFCLLVL